MINNVLSKVDLPIFFIKYFKVALKCVDVPVQLPNK